MTFRLVRNATQAIIVLSMLLVGNTVLAQKSEPDTPDFPGLDIQGVIGFDRMIERSAPVPVAFFVTNNSEKMLEGELILRDSESDRNISLGSVAVGPGGKKRISTVQAFDGWEDVEAEYTDGFTTFWKRRTFLENERSISHLDSVLLVVDAGGRRIALPDQKPKEESQGIVDDVSRYVPEIGQGNRVIALSIRDWQVPIHPGPLTTIRALAFSETTRVESLGDAQWEAVGRWISFGGHVFVPESAPAILEKLKVVCPLAVQPANPRDGMSAHSAGLGTIFVYAGELFATGETSAALVVAKQTSKLSGIGLFKLLGERQLGFPSEGKSYQTRNWVILVFGVYTLIVGAVTLMLFRMSRSRLKAFVVSVVGTACFAAAALGVMLRTSLGDATVITVTQLAESGAIQAAKIEVQSAGGRNFDLGIHGSNPDLQLSETSDRYRSRSYNYSPMYGYSDYYGNQDTSSFAPPFSIMSNLSDRKTEAFQIRVPVQPWGQRTCVATSCLPSLTGLKVNLKYTIVVHGTPLESKSMDEIEEMVRASGIPAEMVLDGIWSIDVQNNTGLEIDAVTVALSKSMVNGVINGRNSNFDLTDLKKSDFELVQIVKESRVAILKPVPAEGTDKTVKNFQASPAEWSERNSNQFYAYNSPDYQSPTVAPRGATYAWVMASVRQSPGITIDEANSDFRPSSAKSHIVCLYLPEEQLPESWRAAHTWLLQKQIIAEKERLKAHFEFLKQNQKTNQ